MRLRQPIRPHFSWASAQAGLWVVLLTFLLHAPFAQAQEAVQRATAQGPTVSAPNRLAVVKRFEAQQLKDRLRETTDPQEQERLRREIEQAEGTANRMEQAGAGNDKALGAREEGSGSSCGDPAKPAGDHAHEESGGAGGGMPPMPPPPQKSPEPSPSPSPSASPSPSPSPKPTADDDDKPREDKTKVGALDPSSNLSSGDLATLAGTNLGGSTSRGSSSTALPMDPNDPLGMGTNNAAATSAATSGLLTALQNNGQANGQPSPAGQTTPATTTTTGSSTTGARTALRAPPATPSLQTQLVSLTAGNGTALAEDPGVAVGPRARALKKKVPARVSPQIAGVGSGQILILSP